MNDDNDVTVVLTNAWRTADGKLHTTAVSAHRHVLKNKIRKLCAVCPDTRAAANCITKFILDNSTELRGILEDLDKL